MIGLHDLFNLEKIFFPLIFIIGEPELQSVTSAQHQHPWAGTVEFIIRPTRIWKISG